MFYKYSTVLMSHTPVDLVEVLMRQPNLDAKKIIPALLNYNKTLGTTVSISQNQAIRYLSYVVSDLGNTDSIIHNLLLSLYAAQPSEDETPLLTFLKNEVKSTDNNIAFTLYVRDEICITNRTML